MPVQFWITVLMAVPLGLVFGGWSERLIEQDRRFTGRPSIPAGVQRLRLLVMAVLYVALCGGLYQVVVAGGQTTFPEVQPSPWGSTLRLFGHQILIGLILVATAVDWDGFVIPDQITGLGMLIGVASAFVTGESQLMHLWVDWNVQDVKLTGPYFPDWFDAHRHWHGVSWSLAGLVIGGGLTWLVRAISSWLMGRETLGFGDVTLMAMIGSFLGWQPTVCTFLLAPLLGLAVGIPLKMLTNKPYIPYGPFLGGSAIIVLYSWGPIWLHTRGIFGDWYGLLILASLAGVGFVLLIGLLLAYRKIPGRESA